MKINFHVFSVKIEIERDRIRISVVPGDGQHTDFSVCEYIQALILGDRLLKAPHRTELADISLLQHAAGKIRIIAFLKLHRSERAVLCGNRPPRAVLSLKCHLIHERRAVRHAFTAVIHLVNSDDLI